MTFYIQKYSNIIDTDIRTKIYGRFNIISNNLNREFWGINNNDNNNGLFVGSYGRSTAIKTSDIDILIKLPRQNFNQYNNLQGNAPSRLLQSVRNALLNSYPKTDIRADGQVVKIKFSDGIFFEVIPCFQNFDGTFIYPDTNTGGNWLSTNPIAEQREFKVKNEESNNLLVDTCRHFRYVRDNRFSSYKLSGIVIDTFVYYAMGKWQWSKGSSIYSSPKGNYESDLLKYFNEKRFMLDYLLVPGSNDSIDFNRSLDGLEKVLNYIAKE